MKDKILLIDGLNFIWRANIKFGSPDKQAFVMVYNFFRNLRALVQEFSPTKIFFCLEGKNNFRYAIYPEYKANRIIKRGNQNKDLLEDPFEIQKKIIIDLLQYLPITLVNADCFEADDVIATLADNLKDEEVVIISNDSDLIQLLQKNYASLHLFSPINKKFFEAPNYHYLAWKCLRGDKKTDNIPGLVSDAKATKLVLDPKAFEEFLAEDEHRADFNLNKELIELRIIPDEQLQFVSYNVDFDFLKCEFLKMGLHSMLNEKYWDRFVGTFSVLK